MSAFRHVVGHPNPTRDRTLVVEDGGNADGRPVGAAVFAGMQDVAADSVTRRQSLIELKRRIPNLPIITDPSHICGTRERLYEISQEAMDLNFDGIIIESHPNPDKAWSDAMQQVTPSALKIILDKLVIRQEEVENGLAMTIGELREEIDRLDDQIIDIFEERMQIADQIGHYKKDHNVSILQSKRWDSILNKRLDMGLEKGLSNEFITRVFRAIHQESINHQAKIMNIAPEENPDV